MYLCECEDVFTSAEVSGLCFNLCLFVSLSVCLSAHSARLITQKIINGFLTKFLEGWGVAQGSID